MSCSGEDHCCTPYNKCAVDEGDCDSDSDCQDGLVCGKNNCPDKPGFEKGDDCCEPSKYLRLHWHYFLSLLVFVSDFILFFHHHYQH